MTWRARGRISRFDTVLGRGYIRYQDYDVAFNAKDVTNYTPESIRGGESVQFELERTHRGYRAKDVMIYVRPKDAYLYLPSQDEMDYDDELITVEHSAADQTTEESSPSRRSQVDLIALALFGGKIKLVSLAEDGTYRFLDEHQKLHNLLYVLSSETIQLEMAVEELESMMNEPRASESDFQAFFERNPDFILNDEYREAHPQLVLSQGDGAELKPDFVLEPVDQSSFCDLLELKLPSTQVFVLKKNRARFAAAVHEAAAQLRVYSRFFDEERNRKRFQSKYPRLKAYRPRMFVIIGRRSDTSSTIQRDIQRELPDLNLRTYDEVVLRMKWKIENMQKKSLRWNP
jgi:cold shock CspA family protein